MGSRELEPDSCFCQGGVRGPTPFAKFAWWLYLFGPHWIPRSRLGKSFRPSSRDPSICADVGGNVQLPALVNASFNATEMIRPSIPPTALDCPVMGFLMTNSLLVPNISERPRDHRRWLPCQDLPQRPIQGCPRHAGLSGSDRMRLYRPPSRISRKNQPWCGFI